MGRFIKWALGIIVGIIIIAGIAVFIILSRYDFNDLKPAISKVAYESTGREFNIDGDIDLKIGLTPSLVLSGVRFQNASWGSRPDMVKLDRFEVKVALLPLLKRNLEVKRLILIEPDILIETNKSGKLNTQFVTSEKAPEKTVQAEAPSDDSIQLPSLSFDEVEIVNGTLTYRDGKTGSSKQIILKKLLASTSGIDSPVDFNLNGTYNEAPFDLSGRIGSIASLTDPDKECSIDITIEAFDASIKVLGSVKDAMTPEGINLGLTINVAKWDKISQLAGQPVPLKDPLNLSGRISDPGPDAYSINDLKINMSDMEITGSAGASLAGKVPMLDVKLASKKLDLRPILADDGKKDTVDSRDGKSAKGSDKIFPADPLPVDALKKVDGKFQFRFAKIILPQLAIDNLEMDVTMKAGSIDVKPLKANAGGGSVNGVIAIRPSGNALEMVTRLTCAKVNLGDTLKQAGITDMLEGIIDVEVDLGGKGSSMASLMADLKGYTSIIMGQGRISNKYIDKIGGGISDSIFRLLNPAREKKDYTAIKCAVGRFDAVKGVADVTVLALDTEIMRVVGAGEINLGTEQLNLSLKPEPKKGVGGLTLNLGDLAQPFRLAGNLASPSLSLDKTQTAAAIGNLISGGLGSLLRKTETEETDLCATAVEIAKTGVKPAVTKEVAEEPQPTPQKTIEDAIKDPGKALKKLFGR